MKIFPILVVLLCSSVFSISTFARCPPWPEPCIIDPPKPSVYTGQVYPKYKVLTVIYAPPGKEGGGSQSRVTYGNGSSWGSSSSSSKSFIQSYAVSVSAEAGFLGVGGSVDENFGYARNKTHTQALNITKSTGVIIQHSGPNVDGIDHNRDMIWLWLRPKLNLSMAPTHANWTVDEDQTMNIVYVYVGYLKQPGTMPPSLANTLQSYGITTADYSEILKANPFADGAQSLDTNRYRSLYTTFPYLPPYSPGDSTPTLTLSFTYNLQESSSLSIKNEYNLGTTVSGSVKFLNLFKAKVKNDNKWTWTDIDTRSSTGATSETVSVTIGSPSYGYGGPTQMRVYYDVIYKTFAFVPIEFGLAPSIQGALISKSGKNVFGKEVKVVADGVTYRTFSDIDGQYSIYLEEPALKTAQSSETYQFQVDGIVLNPIFKQEYIDIMLP